MSHPATCKSPSCCSPLRLWRTLQTIIRDNDKNEFKKLCADKPADIVASVLLTSRVSNDPAQYSASQKSRMVQFDIAARPGAVRLFGKQVTDLNAVQLALILHGKRDGGAMALAILNFLRQNAPEADLQLFVNHVWGQRNTTLHLACFWNLPRIVRLLLDMGAEPSVKNTLQIAPQDSCISPDCRALLSRPASPPTELKRKKPATVTPRQGSTPVCAPVARLPTPPHSRPSLLLKKASERTGSRTATTNAAIPTDYFSPKHQEPYQERIATPSNGLDDDVCCPPLPSPLSFSSSSSTSSYSSDGSNKSNELCYTPPPSPLETAADAWDTNVANQQLEQVLPPIPSPSPVPFRPSCFPTNIKNDRAERPRRVRFDKQAIIIDACIRGDLAELASILEDYEQTLPVHHAFGGVQNRSLLHIALLHGQEHIVRYLVEKIRVDINHPDKDGWTALHYAAALGQWRTLEYFAGLDLTDLGATTNEGLLVYDCPEAELDRRRCRRKSI